MDTRHRPLDPRVRLVFSRESGDRLGRDVWYWQLRGGGERTQDLGLELYRAARAGEERQPTLVARLGLCFVSHGIERSDWGSVVFDRCHADLITWRAEHWPFPEFHCEGSISCAAPNMLVWDHRAQSLSGALEPLDLNVTFEPVGGRSPQLVKAGAALVGATPEAFITLSGRGFAPRERRLHKATGHFKFLPMTFCVHVDPYQPNMEAGKRLAFAKAEPRAAARDQALLAAPAPPGERHAVLWTTLWDQCRTARVTQADDTPLVLATHAHRGPFDSLECMAAALGMTELGFPDEARALRSVVLARQDPDSGFLPARWGDYGRPDDACPAPPAVAWLAAQGLTDAKETYPALSRLVDWWRAHRQLDDTPLVRWKDAEEAARGQGLWNVADDPPPRVSVTLNGQLLAALDGLARLADELGAGDEAARHRSEHAALASALLRETWDAERGFLLDCHDDGSRSTARHAGAFWLLVAGALEADRATALTRCLQDSTAFGTPMPVPGLAGDAPGYRAAAGWGATRALELYVVVLGLMRHGNDATARDIARTWLDGCQLELARSGRLWAWYDSQGGTAARVAAVDADSGNVSDYLGWNALLALLIKILGA